jgi:hypothetical protein
VESIFVALAVLACPIGMGAMMWFMVKGMRRGDSGSQPGQAASVDDLRAEHRRLGEDIERLERGNAGSPPLREARR